MLIFRFLVLEEDGPGVYTKRVHVLDQRGKQGQNIEIPSFSDRQLIEIELLRPDFPSPPFQIPTTIRKYNIRIRIYPLDDSCHMEGVEVRHDPIVMDLHLLQVELTVVCIKLQVEVGVSVFFVAAFNEADQTCIVEGLYAERDYLVHRQPH